jgi:hypothetical protein
MPLDYKSGEISPMKKRRFISGSGLHAAAVFSLSIAAAMLLAPSGAVAGAVRVGERAPQFEIQGFNSQKLQGKKNILLVFYRGLF